MLLLVLLFVLANALAAWLDLPLPRLTSLQPPWPFAWRYDTDLPVSPYVWRKLALAAAMTATAATAALAAVWGLRRRRWRWAALVAATLLFANTPWPRPALYLAPAVPTSFDRSPLPFTPASLLQGAAAYQARCAACHGAAADGRGPLAATLPTWPSALGQPLFQNRLEGEIYWRIRHHADAAGMDAETAWRVIDYLRAVAYGESGGAGMPAVPAPGLALTCRGRGRMPLSALRGQPVRIVAHGPATAQDERDDPRVVTVVLTRGAAIDAECTSDDADAWVAYALLAGATGDTLAGAQFLVDRQGWLRARHAGGDAPAWTSGDDVCGPSGRLHVAVAAQGLAQILKAMDASPIAIDRARRG
ncbi:cytochrome C [Achromobacter aloeverae]|uniref:Cytochrome C n=1 Tax=Achromobacter aloeverae TaxID=1750518 RepID=A0A4Q1HLL3_9BURK|nr:cytochrome C [Achromobacter aloeverae]